VKSSWFLLQFVKMKVSENIMVCRFLKYLLYFNPIDIFQCMLIPVAAQSKSWVCGSSLVGIVCSNTAGRMSVFLLRVLCVVR
jgi:hypothetical protein